MSNEIQFILYNLPGEEGKVQVIIRGEILWCKPKVMVQLFGVDRTLFPSISKIYLSHLSYSRAQVCAKFAHT